MDNITSDQHESFLSITSRIDERIKQLIENNNGIVKRLDRIAELFPILSERVSILESKSNIIMQNEIGRIERAITEIEDDVLKNKDRIGTLERKVYTVEIQHTSLSGNLSRIFDTVVKIFIAISTTYIIIKLGLK